MADCLSCNQLKLSFNALEVQEDIQVFVVNCSEYLQFCIDNQVPHVPYIQFFDNKVLINEIDKAISKRQIEDTIQNNKIFTDLNQIQLNSKQNQTYFVFRVKSQDQLQQIEDIIKKQRRYQDIYALIDEQQEQILLQAIYQTNQIFQEQLIVNLTKELTIYNVNIFMKKHRQPIFPQITYENWWDYQEVNSIIVVSRVSRDIQQLQQLNQLFVDIRMNNTQKYSQKLLNMLKHYNIGWIDTQELMYQVSPYNIKNSYKHMTLVCNKEQKQFYKMEFNEANTVEQLEQFLRKIAQGKLQLMKQKQNNKTVKLSGNQSYTPSADGLQVKIKEIIEEIGQKDKYILTSTVIYSIVLLIVLLSITWLFIKQDIV